MAKLTPTTGLRVDGRLIPIEALASAIAERHGVSVGVSRRAEGIALRVGTWQGLNCLRKSLVGDGYQVLTASDPSTTEHILVAVEPPAGWVPAHKRLGLSMPVNSQVTLTSSIEATI